MRQPSILIILIVCIPIVAGCAASSVNVDTFAEELYAQSKLIEPLPPHHFASDGCSCWPDGAWVECCIKHDLLYWIGGTREERKRADRELKQCVFEKGCPLISKMMYIGVRLGGVWWLPTPFRWGFGWDYPQSGPPGKRY